MNGLSFVLETPYIVNFRKPYSTITLLTFPFPPFTTIRGLIANAMGMGDLKDNRDNYNEDLSDLEISIKPLNSSCKFLDMVLMKKLKPPADAKKRKELLAKLKKSNNDLLALTKKENELYNRLCIPQSTSAPFIKEYVQPIRCKVYLRGERALLNEISTALMNPVRPLYIGASDDFVVIFECVQIDFESVMSKFIDSTVRVDGETYPLDKKLIVGRVPYRFIKYGLKNKRDYFREDIVIAAPSAGERVELNKEINCFKTGNNEYIAF